MNREEALKYLKENVKSENLLNHMYAVEAIMKGLAKKFNQDVDKWALAGLLHDIDYEGTKDKPEEHSLIAAGMLENKGVDKEIIEAVKAHNEMHHIPRQALMEKALYAADPLSGLITAVAYVMPSKKLKDVSVKSIKKKFKDKAFARGAGREQIKSCEEFGLTLDEFFDISLREMKEISDDLGL